MQISQQNIDDLTATITVTVEKEDYAENVEKKLKDYRKNTQTPGFRKGKSPMGLIKKQYGARVQMEEINKIVSEGLNDFLRKADFDILAEPLPSEKQELIDFDSQENYDFLFDIGIAPKIDIQLTSEDSIVQYEVEVKEEEIEKEINSYRSRFGKTIALETADQEDDRIIGDVIQVDANNGPIEDGISHEGVTLRLRMINHDKTKQKVMEARVGDEIVFNPIEALGEEQTKEFLFLEEGENIATDVRFVITEMERFVEPEVDEDLFKKVFEDEVKTEEDFRERIKEDIEERYQEESNMRFHKDTYNYIVDRLKDVALPEAFLKRWIIAANQDDENPEEIISDYNFSEMIEHLRWQLATTAIGRGANIEIDEEDLMETARKMTKRQFINFGMFRISQDMLDSFAQKLLQDPEQQKNIVDQAENEKVIAYVKTQVQIKKEKISMEDLLKLYKDEREEE